MATKSEYPLPAFHFVVDWGGARIGFTEISGLCMETEVIEYREGHNPKYSKIKMPGLQKFSNITMKRGVFLGDFDFYKWWRETAFFQEGNKVGTRFRRTVLIKLLNEEHQPVITWQLTNAWPCKIQSSDLKADSSEVLIESMELVHEGLRIVEAN